MEGTLDIPAAAAAAAAAVTESHDKAHSDGVEVIDISQYISPFPSHPFFVRHTPGSYAIIKDQIERVPKANRIKKDEIESVAKANR